MTGVILGVRLWRTPNPGSLTGLSSWPSALLVLGGVCLLIGMARASGVTRGLGPASGPVIGGLLSNQIDCIRTGGVDDFIAAGWLPSHPNATGLADVAIGIGTTALIALVVMSTLGPASSDARTRMPTSTPATTTEPTSKQAAGGDVDRVQRVRRSPQRLVSSRGPAPSVLSG